MALVEIVGACTLAGLMAAGCRTCKQELPTPPHPRPRDVEPQPIYAKPSGFAAASTLGVIRKQAVGPQATATAFVPQRGIRLANESRVQELNWNDYGDVHIKNLPPALSTMVPQTTQSGQGRSRVYTELATRRIPYDYKNRAAAQEGLAGHSSRYATDSDLAEMVELRDRKAGPLRLTGFPRELGKTPRSNNAAYSISDESYSKVPRSALSRLNDSGSWAARSGRVVPRLAHYGPTLHTLRQRRLNVGLPQRWPSVQTPNNALKNTTVVEPTLTQLRLRVDAVNHHLFL